MGDDPNSPSGAPARCPRCGSAFVCGAAAGHGGCWCAALPKACSVPAAAGATCLCPRCLGDLVAAGGGLYSAVTEDVLMPTALELEAIARRHGVSPAAAAHVYDALRATGGASAQFNHPDLGGPGQWMPGMVMVGDLFDVSLKARVEALCTELSPLARDRAGEAPRTETRADSSAGGGGGGGAGRWWPAEWGEPSAAGDQGGEMRYAYFASCGLLAVSNASGVRVYDTGGRRITGVSQRRRGDQPASVTFTSDAGEVDLAQLKAVER